MELNDYQLAAMKFAKYKYPDYPYMALAEEVGEVMGKLAKHGRKNDKTLLCCIDQITMGRAKDLEADLVKELGDVLWQLQACCAAIGVTLEDVAKTNLDKLSDRDNRGVIVGHGDDR